MNGKWLSVIALVVVASVLLAVSSCGREQQLVSIQVQPSVETFGASNIPVQNNAGAQVQLRALGTYIHPPVTKDITNEVTWSSNDTQMMTVSSTGLLTATGAACGGTLVSATITTNTSAGGLSSSGALVTGYMTGNVVCFTGSGSGGSGTDLVLTVTFAGNGAGNVTSNPSGLSCTSAAPCLGQFVTGTTVMLTGTPTGSSTSVSWLGCDTSPSTNPCSVTMNANRTITATFN
ncbi:MAG TPA: hypothetical protein VE866_05175 [Candidatus Binatia bacterium]|jgi:hypothetical protein|nr:hypothetical protein [Candidatus Binatia bacterium]